MKLWFMTKDGEGIAGAIRSSQNLVVKVSKTCRYVRWELRGDGYENGKHDPTMFRRWSYVQHDGWKNDYGIVIKIRNIVYDKKPLQQAVS